MKDEVSAGHLDFFGDYEYFSRIGWSREVYKAPRSDAIMPNGYRTGRWECTYDQWELTRTFIAHEEYAILIGGQRDGRKISPSTLAGGGTDHEIHD